MVQLRNQACLWIESCDIWPLVEIAVDTGKSQVIEVVATAMILWVLKIIQVAWNT